MFLGLLKDLRGKDLKLPNYRAARLARCYIGKVLDMSIEELQDWYPQFQRDLIAGKHIL